MELERYMGQFIQYAGLTTTIGGRRLSLGNGVTGWVDRRPVGVVAAIVPWNFPASLFGTKLAPALAAGCGFLVKPAESTSLITLRLAEIAKPHLPEGLLNVVIGGGAIAASLVAHPGIRRIAFTGSTEVGRMVAVAGSAVFKRCTLELGGCDPFVLLEGTDLRAAVRALGGTRFYNAGQVCVAPKRLIVERSVLDETVDLLQERLSRVVLGNSAVSPSASMGPMHTFDSRARLLDQIEDAVKHGAQQIGARVPDREDLAGGAYIEPGLLIDPSSSARVRVEETFGPVLTVIPFDFDDQAVQIANETTFGLGASVWGADIDRCMRIVGLIDSGYKWVNALGRVYDELPFGGIKESGIGREHGSEGLDSYLEDISIVVGTGA
jgi:succinate-semialdehyde dehydrogenase/glutarate-semialdehyde dehydrogenase